MERSVKREYMENRTQYQNPLNIATNQTTGNTKQNDLSRKDNNQHEENNNVRNKEKADNSKEKTKEKTVESCSQNNAQQRLHPKHGLRHVIMPRIASGDARCYGGRISCTGNGVSISLTGAVELLLSIFQDNLSSS
jgi:hypothetical protein